MATRAAVRDILKDLMNELKGEIIGCAASTLNETVVLIATAPEISLRPMIANISKSGKILSRISLILRDEFGDKVRSIMVKGSEGYIISIPINDGFLLILTSKQPNLGLILSSAEKAVERLRELLR